MNNEKTYGAEFLDVMDELVGKSTFVYAERKAIREMDHNQMVEYFKPYGYAHYKKAKVSSPQELAEHLAAVMNAANQSATNLSVNTALISLLISMD